MPLLGLLALRALQVVEFLDEFHTPKAMYRLCVGLTRLNKVLHECHILPAVEQVRGLLGTATVFSMRDATASFHQVKLSSQELRMFLTPFVQQCFCRLPFGITSAFDYF